MLETDAGGTPLVLLAQRAAFLPEHRMLLVADAHIGKAVSFRRLGVPVPGGTTAATLQRLSAALQATQARHVVFLGDLMHSAHGRGSASWAALAAWRSHYPHLELTLVRGNHDARAGAPPPEWGVTLLPGPLHVGGLSLVHEPQRLSGRYVLAGHVHPATVLGGRGFDRLRLPCFHLGPELGVLPAFGEFTGMHVLPRAAGDRVFVIAEDEVREVRALHSL